jgi:monofunctional glycosyltransferase
MITRWVKRFWKIFRWFIIGFLVFSICGVVTYAIVQPPFIPLMFTRAGEQLMDGKEMRIIHKWVSIKDMSPNLVLAAIAAEDNNFTKHFGIDFEAIQKAQKYNERKKGRKVRGASTITQQTCKNVYLWPSRSYIRKGFEVYFTLMVETVWTKKRIMEVYLNMIEMGDGIYGAEAASHIYFHKPAKELSRNEAAMIVAAFPNPRKYNPGKPSSFLIRRQQKILLAMSKIEEVDL